MGALTLASENEIVFRRIQNEACTSYKIFVKEFIGDDVSEYFLEEIQNPRISLDLPEKIELKFNKEKKWELPRDISGVNTNSVKVYINNWKLDTGKYTFNPKTKMLIVHVDILETDLVEAEYLVDRIRYVHNSISKCEYKIVPIFKKSHLIGRHTIL